MNTYPIAGVKPSATTRFTGSQPFRHAAFTAASKSSVLPHAIGAFTIITSQRSAITEAFHGKQTKPK